MRISTWTLVALVAASTAACSAAVDPGWSAPPASSPRRAMRAPTPEPPRAIDACGPVTAPAPPDGFPEQAGPFDPPRVAIARPEELQGFYEALARLVRRRADDHVRLAVFGDSNLTMDLPTGRLRRKLQRRFGDGGHGFVALGKPWSHYRHMDVLHGVVSGWQSYAITTKPTGDGFYGLGGIVAENQWQGAITYVETAPAEAPVGVTASRFDFFYLERPSGGSVALRLDGEIVDRVDTKGSSTRLGVRRVDAVDGPHRLEVVATSAKASRAIGVALEREEPGVVVDSFGVGSLNTKTLGRHDPALFASMLAARRYDLIVFLTGANDIFTMDAVPPTMHRLIALCRETLPGVSILMVTPPDRGLHKPMKQTKLVVEQRREVARAERCALWDQYEAMGGAGSMARFVRERFAVGDAVHFNEKGAAFVADRLLAELMSGFDRYLRENERAGCARRH